MKYFTNIGTMSELKQEFKKLAFKHHPDVGGQTSTMQAILKEYNELFALLSKTEEYQKNHETNKENYRKTTINMDDLADDGFKDLLYTIINLDGLMIELCGAWVWISGNTGEHKDTLKKAGCYWARTKKMWYWRPLNERSFFSKGKNTIDAIRAKYGSTLITQSQPKQQLAPAP